MAIKQFENFDYDFAKQKKALAEKRLKYISLALGVFLLLSVIWTFIYSLNLFSKTTQTISQPIIDTNKNVDLELENQRNKTVAYTNANIPYKDPAGKFEINFLTPYISSQIVIIIKTPNDATKSKQEADAIVGKAKQTVDISNVYYINDY